MKYFRNIDNEFELLKSASDGDHKSFEILFLHYCKSLGNYVYLIINYIRLQLDIKYS